MLEDEQWNDVEDVEEKDADGKAPDDRTVDVVDDVNDVETKAVDDEDVNGEVITNEDDTGVNDEDKEQNKREKTGDIYVTPRGDIDLSHGGEPDQTPFREEKGRKRKLMDSKDTFRFA